MLQIKNSAERGMDQVKQSLVGRDEIFLFFFFHLSMSLKALCGCCLGNGFGREKERKQRDQQEAARDPLIKCLDKTTTTTIIMINKFKTYNSSSQHTRLCLTWSIPLSADRHLEGRTKGHRGGLNLVRVGEEEFKVSPQFSSLSS